jgi:hypothetical protein
VVTVLFYCISVTVFFTVIKLVSYRLHLMFDKGEVIQQRPPGERGKPSSSRGASSAHAAGHKNPR